MRSSTPAGTRWRESSTADTCGPWATADRRTRIERLIIEHWQDLTAGWHVEAGEAARSPHVMEPMDFLSCFGKGSQSRPVGGIQSLGKVFQDNQDLLAAHEIPTARLRPAFFTDC